jgi:hypothetical protein
MQRGNHLMHDIETLQSLSGTESSAKFMLLRLAELTLDHFNTTTNYIYQCLLLSLKSVCYHNLARGLPFYVFSLFILSFASCLVLIIRSDSSRAMRFFSSLSLGVALIGTVTGLVTPYNKTSTGLGDFPSLINVTTEELATGLEVGRFTSVDLVKAYSARIMEVNGTLHMVTELNPDALTIAAELDAMRKNGTILGPLHGLPILIKNNIATADQMNNTGKYELPLGNFIFLMNRQLDLLPCSVQRFLVTLLWLQS